MVLALSINDAEGTTAVLVVAVSPSEPGDPADAVAFPIEIKHRLGLDDEPAWIVTTEANGLYGQVPISAPYPAVRRRP